MSAQANKRARKAQSRHTHGLSEKTFGLFFLRQTGRRRPVVVPVLTARKAVGCLIIAPISDRVGRRPCVLGCLLLALLTSVSCTSVQIGFRNREQVKTSLLPSGRSLKTGKQSGDLLSCDYSNGREKQMFFLGIATISVQAC